MIDAFILQGCLSRHVELSRNMMDKNKAMHYEFKLHLKEYSNFLGPGSSPILPQYQGIQTYHGGNGWATSGLGRRRP